MGGSLQKPHIGKIFGTAEKTIVNGRGTHPCTWRGRPPRPRGCDGRRSRARANLWGVFVEWIRGKSRVSEIEREGGRAV